MFRSPAFDSQTSYMNSRELSKAIRLDVLKMVFQAKAAHLGSAFSVADILAVLYEKVLFATPKDPTNPNRDYFILSKGHAGAALYSALAEKGFFPKSWLDDYEKDGSLLSGHVSSHGVPGVELSTGSLGHGPSFGAGIAHALTLDGKANRVFVLVGDGETEEGSVWEAAAYASHFCLDRFTLIVDCNRMQALGDSKSIMSITPRVLCSRFEAFGFSAVLVDGHDHDALERAFAHPHDKKPLCIIANTVKGKGVSFFENNLKFHYSAPNQTEYELALAELEDGEQ